MATLVAHGCPSLDPVMCECFLKPDPHFDDKVRAAIAQAMARENDDEQQPAPRASRKGD